VNSSVTSVAQPALSVKGKIAAMRPYQAIDPSPNRLCGEKLIYSLS
jgi:hypothetical protein